MGRMEGLIGLALVGFPFLKLRTLCLSLLLYAITRYTIYSLAHIKWMQDDYLFGEAGWIH